MYRSADFSHGSVIPIRVGSTSSRFPSTVGGGLLGGGLLGESALLRAGLSTLVSTLLAALLAALTNPIRPPWSLRLM